MWSSRLWVCTVPPALPVLRVLCWRWPVLLDARVNLASERAYCTVDPTVSHAHLAQVIEQAGFAVAPLDKVLSQERNAAADETRQTLRAAFIAGLLTAPVFLLEMGGHLYPPLQAWLSVYLSASLNHLIQAVLITAVLVWPGRVFFQRAWLRLHA